ncbi:hypothetical protein AAFF_G00333710 [Aldrovandia affinis]|uniref:Tenascin n=1 Tax=Aldrovandia affinis TaxID=143900 RepID=A0AAD7R6N8_9TELE|nr:hypothetical protein AAFF_G00333710 [Aldrovandia affinis]
MPLFPALVLLLLPCPALLIAPGADPAPLSPHPKTAERRAVRDAPAQQPIKVLISDTCVQKELELEPGSPLVLTHRISLVPAPGACGGGCEEQATALRERVERLEREVSALREKCGGTEGGCCTSQPSTGAHCTTQPNGDSCPNGCSDQGRCEGGRCVCFPGFSGPDCSSATCPNDCNNKGRCVDGQCVCDSGFTGADCSGKTCPNDCSNKGRCVDGQCMCDSGFTGTNCSGKTCPNDCSNKGRCVDGQCVCDSGFTGSDCSAKSCPGNCNNKGRCVDGKCVCNSGFTGADCSAKSCPGNCNNKGRCVDGRCVCNSGFTGADCSAKSCPNTCRNKGRCVDGRCMCNRGFTGPDCATKSCHGNCNNKGRCVDGRCVCNSGFTGADCSAKSCPNTCRNKGLCVDGMCMCNRGFTGPDCATKSCPGNCNDQGRCVNGKCVCDGGFTGPDCSAKSCPANCNKKGRCVDGKCVCNSGFTGADCSAKSCPNNCNDQGRCVNGRCVCHSGFKGVDCAEKACPNDCNDKGRCVDGRCVCDSGFAGPDCSQCEEGLTGADCSTVLSGVTHLGIKDITDSSATLFWTLPSIQYESYIITFTSQKEGDQKITSKVEGRITSYTQTGLAAGQEYVASVRGEKDGKMGAESTTEFTTLISGPKNLRVVKTTTTSVVVQWEPPLADIDRYRLSISPNQREGGAATGSRKLTLPPERDSAHIEGLEAGRLYDITLVAEKGRSRSRPVTVQATPAPPLPIEKAPSSDTEVAMETPTVTTGTEGDRQQGRAAGETKPDRMVFYKRKGEDETERRKVWRDQRPGGDGDDDGTKVDPPTRVKDKRKDGVGSKQPVAPRKPKVPGLARFNGTRVGQVGKKPGQVWQKQPGVKRPAYGAKETTKLKRPAVGNGTASQTDPGSRRGEDTNGPDAGTDPVKDNPLGGNGSQTPAGSVIQAHSGSTSPVDSGKDTEPSTGAGEEALEQAAMVAGNSTHANGKKCVKKVKVGYRTANGTVWVSGKEPVPEGGANGRGGAKAGAAGGAERDGSEVGSDITMGTAGSDTGVAREGGNEPWGDQLTDARAQGRLQTIHTDSEQPKHDPEHPSPRPALPMTPPPSLLPPFGQPEGGSQTGGTKETGAEGPQRSSITDGAAGSGKEGGKNEGRGEEGRSEAEGAATEGREGGPPSTRHPGPKTPPRRRPLMGPFHNRTRLNLGAPHHPSRGPYRRRIPLRMTNRTGVPAGTRRVLPKPDHQGKQGSYGPGTRLTPGGLALRTNGSNAKTRQSYTKTGHNGPTSTRVGPNLNVTAPERAGPGVGYRKVVVHSPVGAGGQKNGSVSGGPVPRAGPGFASVGVRNVTSGGFTLIWVAPHRIYRNFTVTHREHGGTEETDREEEDDDDDEDSRDEAGVLPGSARSLPFQNLAPQTRYSLTLSGSGPRLRSKTHLLTVTTGPEPPSDLSFSNVTSSSVTVSWTNPQRPVTGFRVTYTHARDEEPVSVAVDSQSSNVPLSHLTPGSSYAVSVISLLGLDESDPIKGIFATLPDPPTDLRAINVTDAQALLLWRPALATVDRYIIIYASEKGSAVTITVSGNAAEQQLKELQGSTVYTVTISSQLGSLQSTGATHIFTTVGGIDQIVREGPRELTASNVTPRSAVLSWKPPPVAVTGYKLTYQTAGEEMREVTLDPGVSQHKLARLFPMSKYTVHLQGERWGQYTAAISTQFTTGVLRFPFPSDCSQELLNGFGDSGEVEIFPGGKQGGAVPVFCDMETDGGGWTVFQRRMDGGTDFFRRWREYSRGFGSLTGEFWLGNELLHNLTGLVPMALRVDLRAGAESVYAHYSSFSVGTQRQHYALTVSGYSGTAGDSLSYHDQRPFSTKDRDPQPFITRCAMSYKGGWWYRNCHEANLNGLYDTHTNHQGVIWTSWKDIHFSIPFTEMKMRPASFTPPPQG